MSFLVRSPRKTSASSKSKTHPHLRARSKYDSRLFSTSFAVMPPISPTVIGKSGRFVLAATHSAVDVFPVQLESLGFRGHSDKKWIKLAHSRNTMQENN